MPTVTSYAKTLFYLFLLCLLIAMCAGCSIHRHSAPAMCERWKAAESAAELVCTYARDTLRRERVAACAPSTPPAE